MLKRNAQFFAVLFAAFTMLSAVGLVATGGWLISSAALFPPILTLQVATVSVRFFGISRGVFRWSERVVSHEAALQGTVETRVSLWNAASILGPRGIWRLRGSDALDRLTEDTEVLQDDTIRVRTPFIAATASAVLLVLVQTINQPLAGLVLALAFIVSGIVIPLITYRIELKVARSAMSVRNDLSAQVRALISHASEMRVSQNHGAALAHQSVTEQQRIEIESQASAWAGLSSALNGLSSGFAVFAGLMLAVTSYLNDALHGPMIAVIALLPWASAEIIATFSQAATAKSRVIIAKERVEHLLTDAAHRLQTSKPPRERILASPSELTVDGLSVSWTDEQVVHDVSFTLRRGESIALTGPSGSGKSSIAAAVLRLVEHQGAVTLDEIPVERLTDFRTHVSALLQMTHVFNMSLRENLLISRGSATDEDLVSALHAAGLTEWLQHVTLDTVLGQSGLPMSGGEAQRLGIARLFLSNAAFIVLDEPTEHLDESTANAVWSTLLSAFKDRGLLVITHDEQVAAQCTHVLRLQNGRLLPTLSL